MRYNPFRPVIIGRANDRYYMFRWKLLPKNNWFNVYLHKFLGDDNISLGLHDHPWNFLTLILWGGYIELKYTNVTDGPISSIKKYKPGNIIYRKAEHIHAVRLHRKKNWMNWKDDTITAWTLNFVFRRQRQWGFWKDGKFTPATHYYNPHEERIG